MAWRERNSDLDAWQGVDTAVSGWVCDSFALRWRLTGQVAANWRFRRTAPEQLRLGSDSE